MHFSDDERINCFMEDLRSIAPKQLEIIDSIRALFLSANNALREEIKYGGLVFKQSSALIGGIYPYTKHISIEFSHGADFPDPAGILEGKGKKRRHLKSHTQDDIATKKVAGFVAQAITLGL